MQVIEHGPKIFEVKVNGHHGFFADEKRARLWGGQRQVGGYYEPIPKGEI